MARPRGKKPAKPKPLEAAGKRVRKQIIDGRRMEIQKLKAELAKIKNPVQKKLLAEQIEIEKNALARFRRQTK